MILRAEYVVRLQHFLMDTARRYGLEDDPGNERLSSAAGLDYVLLVCSHHPGGAVADEEPGVAASCEAVGRAVEAVLDVCEHTLLAPEGVFADLSHRYTGERNVLDAVRGLHNDGVLTDERLQFRILTLRHEIAERRKAP